MPPRQWWRRDGAGQETGIKTAMTRSLWRIRYACIDLLSMHPSIMRSMHPSIMRMCTHVEALTLFIHPHLCIYMYVCIFMVVENNE